MTLNPQFVSNKDLNLEFVNLNYGSTELDATSTKSNTLMF